MYNYEMCIYIHIFCIYTYVNIMNMSLFKYLNNIYLHMHIYLHIYTYVYELNWFHLTKGCKIKIESAH